ncbi:M1 family metallopeptidase [Simiduia sp. 21SJ11W-1]|uniref:M1 family metallopeptidase n=1 Tax=Simiduia sp. 21SJ11W-1 TaxID=2909669 RepID=UPI0020A13D02|nr:M1 family metallopeptidase [Simiduia sp. 21SJ11W-1]UTA48384.1 M1 family metallopeptidase [Simiduia sp. 21SJ11W-1]
MEKNNTQQGPKKNTRHFCRTAACQRLLPALVVVALGGCNGAEPTPAPQLPANDFAQLTHVELARLQLDSPARTRTGQPAKNYWQQQVDYTLNARLEFNGKQWQLQGSAEIVYHNNSPKPLSELVFLLDHNALKPESLATQTRISKPEVLAARRAQAQGFIIHHARQQGQNLHWQVEDTLLTVSLPTPIASGDEVKLNLAWELALTDKVATNARSGVEWLADGSPIIVAAQWFPRAAAFTDYSGWQTRPFLHQGEFSTEFGRYQVTVTAPAHFALAASGNWQNAHEVLDKTQQKCWASQTDCLLINADTARQNRQLKPPAAAGQQWQFAGEQLRDFAFVASPAFMWQTGVDAKGRRLNSLFPNEAAPLWQPFGLAAMRHTLTTFDSAAVNLPMQTVSIANAAGIGMEYPGLATIATRPERTHATGNTPAYNPLTKYDFIGTVIHEVGHNYIPMTVNTDEREWAWLDEGLTSFLEYRAEHQWEANFDVIYGEPRSIASYTASPGHQPVMTPADDLQQKIANAYNKPASLLNMLRYLVLGPAEFDAALAKFFTHWQGKRPTPGDLMMAIEQHTGQNLGWFWRSWFLEARSLDWQITHAQLNQTPLPLRHKNPPEPPAIALQARALTNGNEHRFVVDDAPALADAYTQSRAQYLGPVATHPSATYKSAPVNRPEKNTTANAAAHTYSIGISNAGTALLPVPLRVSFTNGESLDAVIPVNAWANARANTEGHAYIEWQLTVAAGQRVHTIILDPDYLTPDIQRSNNSVEVSHP